MPILGIIASSKAVVVPNSYESIATATGTGSSGTITFSSIPATYSHLQIRCIARTDTGFATDYIQFRFNSDTGSNYTYHGLEGDGASAAGFGATAQTFALTTNITGSAATANAMGTAVIDIIDYASTSKYKTVRTIGGQDQNSGSNTGQIRLISNLWLSTSAINSITFTSYRSASWTTSTTFALYGIKGV
jgi:hypothetical protein